MNAIGEVEQHEECTELAVSPTEEEVMEATGKLKGRKAGGRNCILLEVVELWGTVDGSHAGLVLECVE